MSLVSFDGDRQVIIVEPGVNRIDMKNVYSEWKNWMLTDDNSKFGLAFRVVGGNPLPEKSLGISYFLLDGWTIRPYEGDHRLRIIGNLYKEDGSDPIADTLGDFKVTVEMTVSNIIDIVNTGASSLATCDATLDADTLDGLTTQEEWTITTS